MGKKVNKSYKLPVVVSLAPVLGSGEVTLNLKIRAPKDPSVIFGSYAKDVTINLTSQVNDEPVAN